MPGSVLDGIRVIDFTHVFQGPLATMLLADFGADVIKIERPGMGVFGDNYPSPSRCLTEKCYHQQGVGNSGPRDPSQVSRGR